MDGGGPHAELDQVALDLVAVALGAAEHEGPTVGRRDAGDDLGLVHVVDLQEAVRHGVDGRVGVLDRVEDRIRHSPGQAGHRPVERGREEEHLDARRDVPKEPLDRRQEAEVGHAVGFVDGDDLDAVERHCVTTDQVDQAAWCGDEDVEATVERRDLRGHRGAAVDDPDADADRRPEWRQLGGDLRRQLARGRQHQPGRTAGTAGPRPDEGRDAEGEGLPGTGLGPAGDVAAGEPVGHGERLDGERRGDAAPRGALRRCLPARRGFRRSAWSCSLSRTTAPAGRVGTRVVPRGCHGFRLDRSCAAHQAHTS